MTPAIWASSRTLSPRPMILSPSTTVMRVLRGTGVLERKTRFNKSAETVPPRIKPSAPSTRTTMATPPRVLSLSVGTISLKSMGAAMASVSSTVASTSAVETPEATAPGRVNWTEAINRLRKTGRAFSTISASSSISGGWMMGSATKRRRM